MFLFCCIKFMLYNIYIYVQLTRNKREEKEDFDIYLPMRCTCHSH